MTGEGVARFRDPAFAARPLPPFPAYIEQPGAIGPVPPEFLVRPRFAVDGRATAVSLDIGPRVSLYGTGEQAGPLLRNGTHKVLWNTDRFDYTDRSPSVYQSHPFILAVRTDGTAFGVIIETTYRCEIDLRRGIEARVHGPSPAVTIIERGSPDLVVSELARLTGYTPMPPLWALGYHQCRWSYETAARVREVAAEFRKRSIPCDAIWLDIDYMDGFRCFTVEDEGFPDFPGLITDLHAHGFRVVCMIDPGIKVDTKYSVYTQGRDGDHFILNSQGGEYHGDVWPGPCAFPDYTRAATREWWAGLYPRFLASGIDGVWNDMNEPAVLNGAGKTMPASNRHGADGSLGGPDAHARYHNVYGMLMTRATREGVQKTRPHKRPFVLTRANFLGGQRFAATWTGDNRADWRHLRWSISMALNLGLSGQPFVGPDIGGFVGEADAELFARWMGIGALLPFARGHKIKGAGDHEPWSFGEECERTCRLALERRYRLLPYLYTLFAQAAGQVPRAAGSKAAAHQGLPVVRPLFFADPTDPRLRAVDDAFMIGGDVLVRADISPAGEVKGRVTPSAAPLPRGDWRRFELTEETDPALPSLYLRAGAIVPVGPVRQFTGDGRGDELTLLVALNDAGVAEGVLYEDAGDGYEYLKGECLITHFHAELIGQQVQVQTKSEGGLGGVKRLMVVRVL